MAIIKCPQCGRGVPNKYSKCLHCGAALKTGKTDPIASPQAHPEPTLGVYEDLVTPKASPEEDELTSQKLKARSKIGALPLKIGIPTVLILIILFKVIPDYKLAEAAKAKAKRFEQAYQASVNLLKENLTWKSMTVPEMTASEEDLKIDESEKGDTIIVMIKLGANLPGFEGDGEKFICNVDEDPVTKTLKPARCYTKRHRGLISVKDLTPWEAEHPYF